MFRHHLTPSSELKVSRLFSVECHFGGNELIHREEACRNCSVESTTLCHGSYVNQLIFTSVLKKASDDVETSATS